MKLFILLLRANASRLILALVVSVVSGASSAGLIALVNHVWNAGEYTSTFWIASFLGLLALLLLSGLGAQLLALHLALKACADLRMGISQKVLSTPLRQVEELDAPRVLAVLTEDVNVLARVLPNAPRLAINVTTLLAGGAYMAWLSLSAFAVIGGFVFVGVVIYRVTWKRAMGHIRMGRDVFDTLFDHFRALYEGVKQLKLNRERRRVFLTEDLHESNEQYRRTMMSGRAVLVVAENLTRLIFFGILGMLIFAIPRLEGVEPEVLTGFILMALFMYRPLGLLLEMVAEFGRASVSLKKIDDLGLSLDSAQETPGDATEDAQPPSWQRLEVCGATFSYRKEYDDSVFTMGPIDVSFQPGELVFVVGGNGSGKTTFAKILTGLYPLEGGEIRLDGEVVTEENLERYFQLFSVVFSDYHLFTNLLGAGADDLDEQSMEHLRRLQLDHKVRVSDGRLSTVDLSQGQRKRLALLAAYLEDRPFYVFDEWAADQDPEFKEVFYTRLLPELKARGKAVLVITHDDRYMYVADRCLRIEEGRMQPVSAVTSPGGAP